MTRDIVWLFGGLVLLFGGGEFLVRGSVQLARAMRLSTLFVGMVVVAFGTSAPELLVTLQAALSGSPEIAVGNIIGSNIANMLMIVGLTALVAPLSIGGPAVRREAAFMTAASAMLLALMAVGHISRPAGAVMVAILIAYVSYAYLTERSRAHMPGPEEATASGPQPSLASPLFLVAAGLAGLALGAYLLVDGASGLARYFGVSEAAIGLTVVAFGTSLPELAASVVAALRRHPEVVIGNVVGSNAFNILGNLGLTAVIAPIPISARFLAFDGPVLMASAAIVLLAIAFTGRIGRIGGAGLLAAYVLYIAFTLQ